MVPANPGSTLNKKAITLVNHYVQEHQANSMIEIWKIPPDQNYGDPFTKALNSIEHGGYFYKLQRNQSDKRERNASRSTYVSIPTLHYTRLVVLHAPILGSLARLRVPGQPIQTHSYTTNASIPNGVSIPCENRVNPRPTVESEFDYGENSSP